MRTLFLILILLFVVSCGDDSKTKKNDENPQSDSDQVQDEGTEDPDSDDGTEDPKNDDGNGDPKNDDGTEDPKNDDDGGGDLNDEPQNSAPSVEIKCENIKTHFNAVCTLTASDPDGDDVTLTVNADDSCGGTISDSIYSFVPGTESSCMLVIDADDGKTEVKVEKELTIFNNPFLVKDINEDVFSSIYVSRTVKLGEKWYVYADASLVSSGLYEVNVETGALKEVYVEPFTKGMRLFGMTVAGGKLFLLLASEMTQEFRIMVSDGTPEGTEELLRKKGESSFDWHSLGDNLFFVWEDDQNGLQLWKSDGTKAGTALYHTFNDGGDTEVEFLGVAQGKLIMKIPGDGVDELHSTDGGGTVTKIDEFNQISGAAAEVGENVLFQAVKTAAGAELFVTGGSAGNTTLLKDIQVGNVGSNPQIMGVVGSKLVFSADDGENGVELWVSDGTEVGTSILKELKAGPDGVNKFVVLAGDSNKFFFVVDDGVENLYVTDATADGTKPVDISTLNLNTRLEYLEDSTVLEGTLYFIAESNQEEAIFKSDGESSGKVKDLTSGGEIVGVIDGKLLHLIGDNDISVGSVIRNLSTGDEKTIHFEGITDHAFVLPVGLKNEKLWLVSASNGWNSIDFWSTDGTVEGTVEEFDPFETSGAGSAFDDAIDGEILQIGDNFFFAARDAAAGEELWITDGTEAGTRIVKDINPDEASSHPRPLATLGTKLFFKASDGTTSGFWVTDGTEAGTEFIAYSYQTSRLMVHDNKAIFPVNYAGKLELWASDGTAAGSGQFVNLQDKGWSFEKFFGTLGNYFFFTISSPATGTEIAVSDGTSDGTMLLKEMAEGTTGISVRGAFVEDGSIYFLIRTGDLFELWKSNGTTAGTAKYADIAPGYNIPSESLRKIGGLIFYIAMAEEMKISLFSFDVASKSETKLMDVMSAECGLFEISLDYMAGIVKDRLYFSACDSEHGFEIFSSDGTVEGTIMVADINPGKDSSLPLFYYPAPDGKALYFNAYDGVHGYELYRLDIAE